MNAVIIDDEKKARELLHAMLATYCEKVKVISMCKNLPEGIIAIKKEKPDIVFLDIEMPEYSGLELLNFLDENDINFEIIFTTAYSEYAIRALKMSAVDYLLKPIRFQELINAVEKVSQKKEKQLNQFKILQQNLQASYSKKIVLNQAKGIKLIDTADILFLKGNGAYTEIYQKEVGYILASKNLRHFEDMLLDCPSFFRTQKSYIVNTTFAKNILKEDGALYVLINDHKIAVSPDRVDELIQLLKQ